jgi:phosphonate transport system permease protein
MRRALWLIVTIVVVAAFWHLDIAWERLAKLPSEGAEYFAKLFFSPDWSQFGKAVAATVSSVQMAWIGTVIAAILSLPLSFLAAANITPRAVWFPMRLLFDIIRAVPELILAIAILAVTGLTPFTGALAIGIHSIGTLGKLSFEAIESVETGPIEAARASGASRSQIIRWGIWTQVQPEILSVWLYRFEVNVRAGAVLGLIGAGGIGQMLIENIRYRRWEVIGVLLIVVVVATILIDLASGTVRGKIISGRWPWQRGGAGAAATVEMQAAAAG